MKVTVPECECRLCKIKSSLEFEGFNWLVTKFREVGVVGILASAKSLYHRLTVGDVFYLFGNNAAIAVDLLVAFGEMAGRYGVPDTGLSYRNNNKIKQSNHKE